MCLNYEYLKTMNISDHADTVSRVHDGLFTGLSSGHGSPPEDVCRHITHPFTYCRWEGCLCIDLDDRIVGSQIHCVGSETVVVGGSRTIPEAHNFAKRRLRRTDNHHSQSFLGMNWVEIQKNSSDLGHYFLPPPPAPPVM